MVFEPVRAGARRVTIAANMRAVLLTGHGGYEKLELRDDVPVPKPGVDDVLIRVGAAGVNNTDINTRIGWYSKSVAEATETGAAEGLEGAGDDGWSGAAFQFPRIQGADACGRIVAVGDNVDPARIGERVLVEPVFCGASRYDILYFGSEVDGGFDAIIDATNSAAVPAEALARVEPGGRVVYIGVSGVPSTLDSRSLVLKDVTAVGILSASPGLKGTIDFYSRGEIDPRPIVAATVGLSKTSDVLSGKKIDGAGIGPKIHIDPRIM